MKQVTFAYIKHLYTVYICAHDMFAHFRKLGKIIVRLRQEIEGAQFHSKY